MQKIIAAITICIIANHTPAQVKCTMPNGVTIEQKLSDTCPAGAVQAINNDGSIGKIRPHSNIPAQPIKTDRLWRDTQEVNAEELGSAWPLTTRSGTLSCKYPVAGNRNMPALLITTGSITYAINGIARSHAKTQGWSDIKAIWRDNPNLPGTKAPINTLTERGERLCKPAQ